jgi:hypothetical protein
LREIARANATRRSLFIGTTHLEARQPVVDMGAIAVRGNAAAPDLFRKVRGCFHPALDAP